MEAKALYRLTSMFLMFLVAYFIGRYLYQQWPLIVNQNFHVDVVRLMLGLLLFELYWFYQIIHWRRIIKRLNVNLSIFTAAYFFVSSCLLSYIPGKLANILGMAAIANKENVSKLATITTVLLVQIYAVISGVLVICFSWFFISSSIEKIFPSYVVSILFLCALIGVVLISPMFFTFTMSLLSRLFRKELVIFHITYSKHCFHILIFCAGWVILSFALMQIVNSFGLVLGLSQLPSIMIVFLASYLAGLITVFLPSGLGVVELGLLYGFTVLYGPHQAAIGAISYRLAGLLTIGFNYLCILFIGWYKKNRNLISKTSL